MGFSFFKTPLLKINKRETYNSSIFKEDHITNNSTNKRKLYRKRKKIKKTKECLTLENQQFLENLGYKIKKLSI